MSTMMSMEWSGVTPDQYNQVMRALDLDKNPPAGGIFHVAGMMGGTLRVLHICESQQACEKFQKERMNVAMAKAGITTPPKVQFCPVHNMYAANVDTICKMGSYPKPAA